MKHVKLFEAWDQSLDGSEETPAPFLEWKVAVVVWDNTKECISVGLMSQKRADQFLEAAKSVIKNPGGDTDPGSKAYSVKLGQGYDSVSVGLGANSASPISSQEVKNSESMVTRDGNTFDDNEEEIAFYLGDLPEGQFLSPHSFGRVTVRDEQDVLDSIGK